MTDQTMEGLAIRVRGRRAHAMGGLIVRDEDGTVFVVAGIRAVRNADHCHQQHQGRRNVRASLAESMEH